MLAAFVALVCATGADRVDTLWLGSCVRGKIDYDAPVIETPALIADGWSRPPVGVRYRLEVPPWQAFTIRMRSVQFQGSLVLRGTNGHIFDEALANWHDRHPQIHLRTPVTAWYLDVVALDGERGDFELSVQPGEPPDATARERIDLLKDDTGWLVETADPRSLTDADRLLSLANELRALKHYDEAGAAFERALSIHTTLLGPAHSRTAINALNLAIVHRACGRTAAARRLFEQSLPVVARNAEPRNLASALAAYGALLRDEGDLGASLAKTREAYELLCDEGDNSDLSGAILLRVAEIQQLTGDDDGAIASYQGAISKHGDSVAGADAHHRLGMLWARRGDHLRAIDLLRTALAIRERIEEPNAPSIGDAANALAMELDEVGEYEEARGLYRRALDLLERSGRDITAILGNLALLERTVGNYVAAERIFERVLCEYDATGALAQQVFVCIQLGQLYIDARDFEAARRALERAALLNSRLPADDGRAAYIMQTWSTLYLNQGKPEEGLDLAQQSLRLRQQIRSVDQRDVLASLGNVAAALEQLGRHTEALTIHESNLAEYDSTHGPNSPQSAIAHNHIASVLEKLNRLEEAEAHQRRVVAIFELIHGRDHPDTVGLRRNLSLMLCRAGRVDEARATIQESLDSIHRYLDREGIAATEGERLRDHARERSTLDLLLSLSSSQQDTEREWREVLRWRGRVLRDTRAARGRLLQSGRTEITASLSRLRQLRAAIAVAMLRSPADERPECDEHLTRLQRELAAEESSLNELVTHEAGPFAEPSAVRNALPPGTARVDLVLYAHRDPNQDLYRVGPYGSTPDERALAFVTTTAATERIDLGRADALREAVDHFRGDLQDVRREAIEPEDRPGRRLATLLWAELEPHLGPVEQVVIAPDGFFASIPFDALPVGEEAYLLDRYTFAYSLAPALTRQSAAPVPAQGAVLAMGDVDYDEADVYQPQVSAWRAGPTETLASHWGKLVHTRQEIEALKDAAAPFLPVDVLAGSEATKASLCEKVRGKTLVHLATHGFAFPQGPPWMFDDANEETAVLRPPEQGVVRLLPGLFSGIVCAGANSAHTGEFGLLTAEEIGWLDLSAADLVVASACVSALGGERGAEGLMSLQRAFHLAGARTVIASLWPISDQYTAELVAYFYRRLLVDQRSKSQALHDAKRWMLERELPPSTWAALVLSGEP